MTDFAAREAYEEYLERYEHALGSRDVGQYTKWQGRLVKKLSLTEFTTRNDQYRALCDDLKQIILVGGTINDILVKQVRECAAELIVRSPI
ncbi:MAG TPA: hypothetical protein VH877_22300 [Polyangia bacterium]|jgi:hypothetical protein|nr:hypothetical protein [Polyangia bacterium]